MPRVGTSRRPQRQLFASDRVVLHHQGVEDHTPLNAEIDASREICLIRIEVAKWRSSEITITVEDLRASGDFVVANQGIDHVRVDQGVSVRHADEQDVRYSRMYEIGLDTSLSHKVQQTPISASSRTSTRLSAGSPHATIVAKWRSSKIATTPLDRDLAGVHRHGIDAAGRLNSVMSE